MSIGVDSSVPADPAGGEPSQVGRLERFRRAIDALRLAAVSREGFERNLFIFGCVAIPLGFCLILLGWYGVAHTTAVFEQLPYLASGGFAGLALTVAGGFSFFGYWTARAALDQRDAADRHEELLRQHSVALGEIVDALRNLGVSASASTIAQSGEGPLLGTERGTMYHRADCAAITGRDSIVVGAGEGGRRACALCRPPQRVEP